MSKKEEFKSFAKSRPELVDYIKEGSMSWQSFYELYDIYGTDNSVWNKYSSKTITNQKGTLGDLSSLVKKVDVNSVQKHIGTAQKAINLFKEFSTKSTDKVSGVLKSMGSSPALPRPLNKFFED